MKFMNTECECCVFSDRDECGKRWRLVNLDKIKDCFVPKGCLFVWEEK